MALTKKFIADGQDAVILTEYKVGPKAFQPHSRDGGKKRVPKTNYSDSESPLGTFTLTAYLPQQDWKEVKIQCMPGRSLQEVLEVQLPELKASPYNVYQFPVRSLLNVQRSCTSVNGNEITIEKASDDYDTGDQRLAVSRALQKSEDSYLSNVQSVLENYCEPLRKWGVRGTPLNELFETLSELRDILVTFYTKVEVAVRNWERNDSLIGELFNQYSHLFASYEEYYQKYPNAVKYLKQRKAADPVFVNFIEQIRGAERHTLESLLRLPISRIWDYDKLVDHLMSVTPDGHPDYSHLKKASMKLHTIVQCREDAIKFAENENKLIQVQSRFPHDFLRLNEPMDFLHVPAAKKHKFVSNSPSLISKAGRSKNSPRTDESDGGGTPDHTQRKCSRMYLHEGPVTFVSPNSEHRRRYMFLFKDLLIVGKPGKSRQNRNFRLKHWVPMADVWISENVKDVAMADITPEKAFVIGWPTVNFAAVFGSSQERDTWYSALTNQNREQQDILELKALPIHVVNGTNTASQVPDPLMVSCDESAASVLLKSLRLFKIEEDASNFQLCVKSTRDDVAVGLIGHEHPFSILLLHISQQLHGGGESSVQNAPVQFLVRRKVTAGDGATDGQGRSKFRANILQWYRRKAPRERGSQTAAKNTALGLFGKPLDKLVVNGEMPVVLKDILVRLHTEGPSCHGVFRKSANYAKKLELKAAIDRGDVVDVSDLPMNLVAALMSEFLRNIPGSLFGSQRYIEFVASNDVEDVGRRAHMISRIISRMPESNQVVLCHVFQVLHSIARNHEVNEMNAANLAICLAPTLLWPESGIEVIRNEVPPMIIFMIDYTPEIFGNQFPEAFKEFEPFNSCEPPSQAPTLNIWSDDQHPAADLSGCDEVELDSEEGAASDSQAYSEVKMSPRKPNSSRRYFQKWVRSFDSESPDISDEDSEGKQKLLSIPPWQPAKPRMRSRNSNGGRDRKGRRRTIGGIVDGELLGPLLGDAEGLEQLTEQVSSLPSPVTVEYTVPPPFNLVTDDSETLGNAEKMPQSNQIVKPHRKRHGRRRTEGPVNLGGLVGKSLVSYDAIPFYRSTSDSQPVHPSSMSDSMGSNSSLDQLETKEGMGVPKLNTPARHSSMISSHRPRRKHRRVTRSSSLRETRGHQQVTYTQLATGNSLMKAAEKVSCSSPSIPSEGPETSMAYTHGMVSQYTKASHHDKGLPLGTTYPAGGRQDPTAAGRGQHVLSPFSQDEGLGSSVSATPASTLNRPTEEQHPGFGETASSLSGNRLVGRYGQPGINASQNDWRSGISEKQLFWKQLEAVNNQHPHTADTSGLPSVVRFKRFTGSGSVEHPQLVTSVARTPSQNSHEHGSVQVTVAKYKDFSELQQPQKIYYRYNPEYYTDL